MATKPPVIDTPSLDEKRRLTLRAVVQAVSLLPILIFIVFVPAGTLDWPAAWALLVVYLGGLLSINLWLIARHTGLARERLILSRTTEKWDLALIQIGNILLLAILLPLCGMDHRLGLSPPFPACLSITALIVFAAMFPAICWAMSANDYFSAVVRLQCDRGHAVADRGPYRVLRHPGYVMMILQFLAPPLVLGSAWGMVPALAIAVLYVYRTAREDRFLLERLPGYAEYARRVRWRLLPGIW
jgi:protein-S-isoprenylcysteine O-methyltransferase Ste14